MIRPLTLTLLLTLGLTGLVAAQKTEEQPPWYQVELIVFTQPGNALDQELWSEAVWPRIAENAIDLRPVDYDPETDLKATPETAENPIYREGAFTLLEAEANQLPLDPNHFNRNGYRPLFHGSWRQPLLPRAQSRPIRIQGGEALPGGTRELDGAIQLDIARYLHLRTDLFFTQPLPDDWQSPLLPPIADGSPTPSAPAALSTLGLATVAPAPRQLSVKLEQARRLRGGEVHYLDHPLFGLIIRLTPWEPPQPEPVADETPALPIPVESPVLSSEPTQ